MGKCQKFQKLDHREVSLHDIPQLGENSAKGEERFEVVSLVEEFLDSGCLVWEILYPDNADARQLYTSIRNSIVRMRLQEQVTLLLRKGRLFLAKAEVREFLGLA